MKFFEFKIADGATLKIVLAITQQPIAAVKFCVGIGKQFFAEFRQWDRCPRSTECFSNAVWASASGAFSYRLRYTCFGNNRLQDRPVLEWKTNRNSYAMYRVVP